MLALRPNCECCDSDLPPAARNAMICSFECTFCRDCVENKLGNRDKSSIDSARVQAARLREHLNAPDPLPPSAPAREHLLNRAAVDSRTEVRGGAPELDGGSRDEADRGI